MIADNEKVTDSEEVVVNENAPKKTQVVYHDDKVRNRNEKEVP